MWSEPLPLIQGEGACHEIVGPRSGATLRSLYHIRLAPTSRTVEQRHAGEAVYYVLEGSVSVSSPTLAEPTVLSDGGMFHVQPHTTYAMSSLEHSVIVGGPSPVDNDFGAGVGDDQQHSAERHESAVRFFHIDEPGLLVPFISADARLIVWYGAGAITANMNYVVMEPGERNKEHVHRYSEDTIYIVQGHGTAEDVTNKMALPFGPGDTVTIPPGVIHAISADRGERVVSAGGPCPADLDMLRAAGVNVPVDAIVPGGA